MPLTFHRGDVRFPVVREPESMLDLIEEFGIIPFFKNPVSGYSIEEHTPTESWFTEDNLGPWDWKIDCVQSGEIAYGKFLWGGKAAFATVDVYREIMNWRRAQSKYNPTKDQKKILEYTEENGSVSVPEVRRLLGITKSAADALLAKLQMQARLVTGDIARVYRGPDLTYSGWQRSTFCTPEALFEEVDFPFPGFKPRTLKSSLTPAESWEFLIGRVQSICGDLPDKVLVKMLG